MRKLGISVPTAVTFAGIRDGMFAIDIDESGTMPEVYDDGGDRQAAKWGLKAVDHPDSVVPAVVPYESETSQLLTKGAPHFGYVNGVLMNLQTNQPVPVETHDPMPTRWGTGSIDDQVGRLFQWQLDHAWMGQQIVIDGSPLGQPGDASHPLRFTTAGGRLALENNVAPPEAPTTVTVPPVDAGPSIVDITLQRGQKQYRFSGDFHLVSNSLRAPVVSGPGRFGFVKVAPQIGGDTLAGTLEIDGGDRTLKGEAAGSVFFSVGPHLDGEYVNFIDGAAMAVSGVGIQQAVIVDVRTADY